MVLYALFFGASALVAGIFFLSYYTLGDFFADNFRRGLFASVGVLLLLIGISVLTWYCRRWRWAAWLYARRGLRMGGALALICLGLSAGGRLGYQELAPPCPIPTEIPVLASQDNLAAVQAAVTRFEQDGPAIFHQACYAADITVYAARSDSDAESDLESGWSPGAVEADGPRPLIWLPDSTEEAGAVADHARSAAPRLTVNGPTANSPLVIAVPTSLISQDDIYGERQAGNWGALYRTLQQKGIALSVPNPGQSATGLLGVTGIYADLEYSKDQEISASGDFPTDDGALLCAAAQTAEQYRSSSAYLVSAAALEQYSKGELTEGACPTLTPPFLPLTALEPSDAASLDFPFVTLNWGGGPAAARQAQPYETALYRWLTGSAGQSVLQSYGLEPPQQPALLSNTTLPAQSQLQGALRQFDAKAPADRILVAIDDSGPMEPHLQRISAAVTEVLGTGKASSIGSGDSFGIWTFPGAGTSTYRALVPFGGGTDAQRNSVAVDTSRLSAHFHSAEFDLVVKAAKVLYSSSATSAQTVNSVILLTDGDGHSDGQDPDSNTLTSVVNLLHPLVGRQLPVRVFVIAFGDSGCAQAPPGSPQDTLTALATDDGGTCVPAIDLGQQLGQLIGQLSAGS